ncbi:hypothetical protein MTQ10_30110 [Streptomyces sp. XM83C]|uniref:Uncharacterized protein n=1 Tax=Streptomyces thermocoprophilus TaxID=78356 RepID=A0ABV5V7T1_9ACTN|nr:hypothetical protein [Streptomyces sp. XM83C]MCK1823719.1 hypothetical protein [Streptomyces sp. XM83C]
MQPVLEPVPSRGTELGAERPRRAPARILPYRPRPLAPGGGTGTDLLRIIADPATPVFLTVHAGGRRRYGYWRASDGPDGAGGCYVALPTEECDALREAGRIELGEPIADPGKTTYRVRALGPVAGGTRGRRAEPGEDRHRAAERAVDRPAERTDERAAARVQPGGVRAVDRPGVRARTA